MYKKKSRQLSLMMNDELFCSYKKIYKCKKSKILDNPVMKYLICNSDDLAYEKDYITKKVKKWKNMGKSKNRETPKLSCRICESMIKADKMFVNYIQRNRNIQNYA